MNAPDLARFQPPTYAEEAAAAAEATEQRHRYEHAQHMAYTALRAGLPCMLVDRTASSTETLGDLLSYHTCNHRTDIDGAKDPCDLLAVLVAEALRSPDERAQKAAEAFAKRISTDYAVTRAEVQQ